MLEPAQIMPPPEYSLMPAGPFSRLTGPYYARATDTGYSLLINIAHTHLNRGRSVHGGMLLAISDNANVGAAEMQAGGAMVSTISLHCDFIGMAGRGWLEATARVNRKTSALIFTSGEIRVQGQLIMTSSGIFKVLKAR